MADPAEELLGYDPAPPVEGDTGEAFLLHTARGDLFCLLHPAPGAEVGVLWTGGYGGGIRHPIYKAVAEQLAARGIESLRLRARVSGDIYEATYDVQIGQAFLERRGLRSFAVVGHSFGGAVAISAAIREQSVVACVAMASQTYGAQGVAQLSPRCSLLLIHGTNDSRLGPHCSEQIYSWAKKPKDLVLMEGADHGLMERMDDVCALLGRWLPERLGVR
ncbi:MAG: alpha/beta hydrolase [Chloroflexi bacterium]|nr:alpha/beta hydrolase [Chloroflexota bacterium]